MKKGYIHIEIPVDTEMYRSIYKDVPFYSDTGGWYYENPTLMKKEYFEKDDKRIVKIFSDL